MTDPMKRLLNRRLSGWKPVNDEIDMRIPQQHLWSWQFAASFTRAEAIIIGYAAGGRVTRTDQILWIDSELKWALRDENFAWLHEDVARPEGI